MTLTLIHGIYKKQEKETGVMMFHQIFEIIKQKKCNN